VVGAGRQIRTVQAHQPQGVSVHPTGGVILPGLIDLHGHPEFNVFAAAQGSVSAVVAGAWSGVEVQLASRSRAWRAGEPASAL
jgi:cytosine/adenosine deaminase-related metal-dependent hydrolase